MLVELSKSSRLLPIKVYALFVIVQNLFHVLVVVWIWWLTAKKILGKVGSSVKSILPINQCNIYLSSTSSLAIRLLSLRPFKCKASTICLR